MTHYQVAPMLAVALLFDSKDAFANLSHVVTAVSLFLDSAVELPLHKACTLGSLKLLDRIWASSEAFVDKTPQKTSDKTFTLREFIRTDKFYRQHQFSLSMEEAVKQKSLEMVKWLSARFQGCTVPEEVGKIAAKEDSRDIIEFLLESDIRSEGGSAGGVGLRVEWSTDLIESAISNRRSDVVWWLRSKMSRLHQDLGYALNAAVEKGDVIMAEWLIKNGAHWWHDDGDDSFIEHYTAANGHLEVLQWLDQLRRIGDGEGLLVVAANKGHMHVVRWAIERDIRMRDNASNLTCLGGEASVAIHAAAVNGHLEIAKLLHSLARRPTTHVQWENQNEKQRDLISSHGRFEAAESVSGKTMAEAARNGHLDVVKWLYLEYGDDPFVDIFSVDGETSAAMDLAASNNHLEVLEYLLSLQAPLAGSARKRSLDGAKAASIPTLSDQAVAGAAGNGHLPMVEWLFTHQHITLPSSAFDLAASSGHLSIVQWLHGHQVECTQAAMDGAAANGYLAVVQWLHNNTSAGCSTNAMDGAAGNGHLDVVKWLHWNRSEGCTTGAMNSAAANGHFRVVEWLHVHSAVGCTEDALMRAARKGDFETFLFLHLQCNVQWSDATQRATRISPPTTIRLWIAARDPTFADLPGH